MLYVARCRVQRGRNGRAQGSCTRATAALLSLLVGLIGRADAQTRSAASSWSVSPSAGLTLNGDARAAGTLAGAVGYDVSPRITLEGELTRIFDMASDDEDVALTLTTAAASILYRLGAGRLSPYLAAGVGAGWFSHALRTPEVDVDVTALGLNVGAGAMYALTPRVLARGDFRYMNHTHGATSDPQQILTVDDVPTVWRFTGGLTIRLPQ
jgi:opacity protein-like surface antigen